MKRLICLMLLFLICLASANAEGTVGVSIADCSENALGNIRLAIDAIDGTTLSQGDVFSFNKLVGPRTESHGFRGALNGRGVKVIGGGVARVASCIYMALQESHASIAYRERYSYGSRYKGSYVSDAANAILVDYASGIDFSFVCNEPSLSIDLFIENDEIRCVISTEETPDPIPATAPAEFSFTGISTNHTSPIASSYIDLSDAGENTVNNITIAAECIDGTVIAPGDVFSFNKIVGPRTEKYGYRSAPNGRGANVIGGGVAQVASAIWLSIEQLDDISVLSRSTYGSKFKQKYVASSNDAILTDYKSRIDFSFRNDSNSEIAIKLYIADDMLQCEISR